MKSRGHIRDVSKCENLRGRFFNPKGMPSMASIEPAPPVFCFFFKQLWNVCFLWKAYRMLKHQYGFLLSSRHASLFMRALWPQAKGTRQPLFIKHSPHNIGYILNDAIPTTLLKVCGQFWGKVFQMRICRTSGPRWYNPFETRGGCYNWQFSAPTESFEFFDNCPSRRPLIFSFEVSFTTEFWIAQCHLLHLLRPTPPFTLTFTILAFSRCLSSKRLTTYTFI